MSSTSGVSIDPVSAIIAVMAAFLSPALANLMGTYSVIFVSAAFGAGWALMRRNRETLPVACFFVFLMTGTATLMTAGVSEVLNHYLNLGTTNYLLAPVALLIAGIGHDWPKVLPWAINLFINRGKKEE